MALTVTSLIGPEINSVLQDLARLRMAVFREWPYIYDGSLDYEEEYLRKFCSANGAVCVIARDDNLIVGASTGSPMLESGSEFSIPFEAAGYDVREVFYCGESVLLPSYRGQGLGHKFFDEREAQADRLGRFRFSTFCRVVRRDDHSLRPAHYRPLDNFWRKRGYVPIDGLTASYSWKDLDQKSESEKPMQFWVKEL